LVDDHVSPLEAAVRGFCRPALAWPVERRDIARGNVGGKPNENLPAVVAGAKLTGCSASSYRQLVP